MTGKSRQDLIDMVLNLAASLKEDDLENPETFGIVSQLVQILENKAAPIPQELVDQLNQIKDKGDRFRQAASTMGADSAEKIEALKESMKSAGLLKAEVDHKILDRKHFRGLLRHADSLREGEEWLSKGPDGFSKVRAVADSYAKSKGLKLDHTTPAHSVDPAHATKIAEEYSAMKHDPSHPDVKKAYGALVSETVDQYKHLKDNGLKVSRIKPGQDNPYKNGSKDLINDVHTNNHMWYFPTEHAFGSGDATHPNHPLLQPTGEMHEGKPLLANDAFRIVHDYFGHAKEGHSFGPKGEDNAWKNHMQMYSPEAQKALTSETRGQNSWVNFGPHGDSNRKNPQNTVFAEQKAGLMPAWTREHKDLVQQEDEDLAASEAAKEPMKSKLDKMREIAAELKKSGYEAMAKQVEDIASALQLAKGQDEKGNPIRGSNKRLQQAKVFGTKSDVKVDKKGVTHSKIPDANGARTSPQRIKMMNTIKDYADKKMGSKMVVAEGKRDESGALKVKAPIEKEPFDVFSAKGHAEEKARSTKIKETNASAPAGTKPIKRVDPKPDHRSGNLETQPSPDAAIHEIAHEALAPKGMGVKEHQTHMDKLWGQHQKDYGHMQQKKTAGEVQPMAAENSVRREMGLPANKTGQKVKDAKKPVEQTVDGSGPRFNRAKDSKGNSTDLMRQSRLLHPANKARIDQLRDGQLKHDPVKGIHESTTVDAKINARASKAPKALASVTEMKPPSQKPEKLAASELARGESYRNLKEKDMKKGKGPCWDGYEKVPGKKNYDKGSCKPIGKKK